MQILKIENPEDAPQETLWELTRLSMEQFYTPVPPTRESWDIPGTAGYKMADDLSIFKPGTDTYAELIDRKIAVTPISLDMTANVAFDDLEKILRQAD
jgi:broad specificity polyphosphatase/5'/3'-nucleotidase SurE